MNSPANRAVFLATLVLVILGLMMPVVQAQSPNANKLVVRVLLDSSSTPAPAGVNVTLYQEGTGLRCNSTTGIGGLALFASNATCSLTPGWYSAWIVPQVDTHLAPNEYIVPGESSHANFYASSSVLASGGPEDLTGVSVNVLDATVRGNVSYNGAPVAKALVEIRDPSQGGFALANATFTGGTYSLPAPVGNWIVYAQANVPGATTPRYNFTATTVASAGGTTYTNVNITQYLVQGYLSPTPRYALTNSTNVTLFDESNGFVYSGLSSTGNFFQVGTYASLAGATSGAAGNNFILFLAPQGYTTATRYLHVSSASPTSSLDVPVASTSSSPPTTVQTTISFPSSFRQANVTSQVVRTNGSTFSSLPNASVGNLYAQIGLDFGSPPAVNATPADFAAFQSWLATAGPAYPATALGLEVNGSGFIEGGAYHLAYTSVPTDTHFTSGQSLNYTTTENYTLNSTLKSGYSSYTITLGFRYPTSSQGLSYTVNLPQDYVLAAHSAAPAGTTLTPSGPGGTWTSFTLSALQSPNRFTNATAQFTVYKFQNVSAIVNATSGNFAFSSHNVLNSTRGNYTVIVGAGQNTSLSAANSIVPSFFNVTTYRWDFGDGSSWLNTTNASTWHYYTKGGAYHGTLTIIANGGQTSTTNFLVLVAGQPPAARISTNATRVHWLNPSDTLGYVYVNWSRTLQFNATGSTSTLYPGATTAGFIATAAWNITAGPTYRAFNYSLSAGARPFNNVTYSFLGAGAWLTNVTINGTNYPTKGWVYKVSLTEYDAGGNKATATLWVLVNDTEKPVPVAYLWNANNQNISSAVESANETAYVRLVDKFSYDAHNGSIAAYNWTMISQKDSAVKPRWFNSTTSSAPVLYLPPSTGSYWFNLTVQDLAGNRARMDLNFTVSANRTIRPILQVGNFTGPTSVTAGDSYTVSVNVTNVGGNSSIAENVTVYFYLTSPASSTQRTYLGSPTTVEFFGYTGGVINGTANYTGLATLRHNQTFRAVFTFKAPGNLTGNRVLWANATATNEFSGDYGANVLQSSLAINPTPTNQYLEYGAIAAVGIIIIALVYFAWRRRSRGGGKGSGGRPSRSGSKGDEDSRGRGSKGKAQDEDDEDE